LATIPLVALNAKAPQQEDSLQKFGQLQQLKALQQQSQLQQQEAPLRLQALQQQTQTGQVNLQQAQQAQKDSQAVTAAMQQYDGKDINQLAPLVLKNGGSAQAVFGIKKQIQEQQQAAATTFKAQADAGKAIVETAKQKNDMVSGALAPLLDPAQVPDAQLPQAAGQIVQQLTQQGLLDQPSAQKAMQLVQSGDPNAIRQGVNQFSKTLLTHTQILDQAHKEAQEANDKAMREQAAANAEETKRYHDVEAKQRQQQLGIEGGRLAVEKQRVALQKGDPQAAARLLVDHDATLSELKARGSTPEFIAQTLKAAHEMSGGKYNAQAADAEFSVAKSPANVAFFGSAKSLTDPGGTLDQLAAVGKTIPGNKIPAFNSISDWEKAATGNGPLAKYASTALGVADDYAKVMGGGQGSDTSRLQALNLIKSNASPEARAGALEGIRGAVVSQTKSRIGKNPVLGRMYGDEEPAAASGGFDWNAHPVAK
jgi:hypothetical protein